MNQYTVFHDGMSMRDALTADLGIETEFPQEAKEKVITAIMAAATTSGLDVDKLWIDYDDRDMDKLTSLIPAFDKIVELAIKGE